MNDAPVLASGLSRTTYPIGETRETILNTPSKEALAFPFYWTLPTDHVDNIRWRLYVKERCLHDEGFRANIKYMCQQDVAFFVETFCVVFEPRPTPRAIPLKLWCDQVDVLAWANECYGKRDVGLEKSRGIGASWLFAIFMYHKWQFMPDTKIAISTKDETSLDGPDSNTLLGKLVYLHENMPAWLRMDAHGHDIMYRDKGSHVLHNKVNGATVQGFVSTNDKLRSLRFTSILYDEFAFYTRDVQAQLNSSVHTCPNRFFISTWNGPDNGFHTIMRKEESTLLRISMYWWNNSERYKGCYTSTDGVLQILDHSYSYPPDYPFVLDGLKRSPWVDFELSRPGSSVQSAMEELYGLMAGDSRLLFQQRTRDIMSETVRPWLRECELYDGELVDEYEGRVKLLADNLDKRGPFSAGCDLSFGAGATYSTLEIIDLPTGEQVLEMAANDLPPISFCQYVYGVLNWLNGDKGDGHTYLDFENNGNQGITFAEEIKRLGYGNVTRRSYSKKGPSSRTAGEYLGTRNRDGGLFNLSEVERAILAGELRVRSELLRRELSAFVKDDGGKPLYPKGEDGHGDRAQGFGIAWANTRKKEFGQLKEDIERQRDPQAEIKGAAPAIKGRNSWSKSWSLRRSGWGL